MWLVICSTIADDFLRLLNIGKGFRCVSNYILDNNHCYREGRNLHETPQQKVEIEITGKRLSTQNYEVVHSGIIKPRKEKNLVI